MTNEQQTNAVRDASRRMVRELGLLSDRYLADVGHAEAHVLVELERAGEATATTLTSTLLIDKAAVSRTLTGLIDDGLVQRRVDVSVVAVASPARSSSTSTWASA